MNLQDAATLARELMNRHGLYHWSFGFNRRNRSLGVCYFRREHIALSTPLTLVNAEAEIRDTILHEIAHAIAGAAAGHGPMWKLIAIQVGAKPHACSASAVSVPGKWEATCPNCGQLFKVYRRLKRVKACGLCCKQHNGGRFSPAYALAFHRVENNLLDNRRYQE